MRRHLAFLVSAVRCRAAFIDVDGCLVRKFHPPANTPDALQWWIDNLQVTPVIRRRLPLLYLCKLLGVKLVLWTNRHPKHETVTTRALGVHAWLFDDMVFYGGTKSNATCLGPVMDDEERHVIGRMRGSMLVRSM